MRVVKPSFFTNERVADLPPLTRILFQGLWCVADREGRLEDRPRRIKIEVLPYDDLDVDIALDALQDAGFITRYRHGGVRYIQVNGFKKHQTPNPKEIESVIPAPCHSGLSRVPIQNETGENPESHLTGTGTGTGTGTESAQAKPAPRSRKNRTPIRVMSEHELSKLVAEYPDFDVGAELENCRNIATWEFGYVAEYGALRNRLRLKRLDHQEHANGHPVQRNDQSRNGNPGRDPDLARILERARREDAELERAAQ